MKLTLELPDMIRVVATSDYKGNPLTVLLIGDAEVLYASGHEPGGLAPATWEDVFRTRVGRIFADLLLGGPAATNDGTLREKPVWHRESPTGRETWGHDSSAYEVRLTQDQEAGQ
jgi:hypothetical protein